MQEKNRTKKELLDELAKLRRRVIKLEKLETKRKQVEESLPQNELYLKAVMSSIQAGVMVIDTDKHEIVDVNKTASELIGATKEKIIGRICHEFVCPAEKGKCPITDLKQIIDNSERTLIDINGRKIPIIKTVVPLTFQNRTYLLESFIDITERKKAEESLKDRETFLQLQFNRMPIGCITWDFDFHVLTWNPAAEKIFGFTVEEAKGKHPYDLIVPKDAQPHVNTIWQRLLEGDITAHSENENIAKDGRTITCYWVNTPLKKADGKVIGVISMVQDITERKKLEEQLLQSQKMEAVGSLAGGVAHDFNNILTAIIGYGTLLEQKVGKDNRLSSYTKYILQSAERAVKLTNALLAFSRKQMISLKPIDLNKTVTEVEKLLTRLIGEDIEFTTVLTEEDLTIMADSAQIEQMLMNLATNARDAMPDRGSLLIKTERAEIDHAYIKAHGYGKPGIYALITVEDTGYGMDEKTKEQIFDPFFTTKEVDKGTGLGLSMVYGLVKQHDGYITCYSEVSKGTIFKIYLPLIESEIIEKKPENHSILKGGTETILVAEDDAMVRQLMVEILKDSGYTVIEAVDGEEAIKAFNENKDKIHLLIFDAIMPKKNGKEVYNEIKKVRLDIKQIFISGYDADIIHKKGIVEEGLNFISKPISPNVFLKKVREVLDI